MKRPADAAPGVEEPEPFPPGNSVTPAPAPATGDAAVVGLVVAVFGRAVEIGAVVATGSVVVIFGTVVLTGSVVVTFGTVVLTGSVVVICGTVVLTGSVVVICGTVVLTGSVVVICGSVVVMVRVGADDRPATAVLATKPTARRMVSPAADLTFWPCPNRVNRNAFAVEGRSLLRVTA